MKSNTAVRSAWRVGQSCRSSSSHSRVAKKLSATALSSASPMVPIEATRPVSVRRLPNARLVYWQPWMLPYESSGSWERRGFAHEVVDLAGEVALDAADGLELGVALGGLAGDIGLGLGVNAHAGDGGHVQGPVGLTVAAAVEAVALGLAGGGGQRGDPAQHREAGLAADAAGVIAQGDQDLSGDL